MFKACPTCKGWGIPIGLMVFKVELCQECQGKKIVDEFEIYEPFKSDLEMEEENKGIE